jgi:hypothetical protein
MVFRGRTWMKSPKRPLKRKKVLGGLKEALGSLAGNE